MASGAGCEPPSPESRAPSSGLLPPPPPLSPPPRQVGDRRQAHLGSGRSPRGAQVTPAARPRQLRARGRCAPPLYALGPGLLAAATRCSEPGRARERAGASAYHLRTFSIAAMTLLISSLARLLVSARTDLPDMVLAGRERERKERERGRLGERARRVLLATLARSLTRAQTHTHTHTRTHKAWCRRAPGAQCASAGAAAAQSEGERRGRQQCGLRVPPPSPGSLGDLTLGKLSRVTPTSQHAGRARARTHPEAAGAMGGPSPPPRHTPWGWQTAGRGCSGSGWWPRARSCKFLVGRLSSQELEAAVRDAG